MEDVTTDFPPPSRFLFEDLNNFTSPPPPLPSPFLLLQNPEIPPLLNPNLLIIACSRPSTFLLHQSLHKTVIGSVILPEFTTSSNSLQPSPDDNSALIYSLGSSLDVVLLSVQYPVSPERSSAVSKAIFDRIRPKKVLALSSIQSMNFRGNVVSVDDDCFAFKVETREQRMDSEGPLVKDLEYLPSGSLIDGIAAAVLVECQVRKINGTLVVSFPDSRDSVVLLKSVVGSVVGGIEFDQGMDLSSFRDVLADCDLYT